MNAAATWRREFGPIQLEDLVRYAGASGDFNMLHLDARRAQEQGYRTNLAHGMYGAGLLGVALAEHVGCERIRRFGVRFVAPLWCGSSPSVTIRVSRPDAQGVAAAEMELIADGRVVTTGWAELAPVDEGEEL